MNPEISKRLREPIPGQLIKKLPDGNDYISGQTAIDRLIQATGETGWSFEIVHTNVVTDASDKAVHVAMLGMLSIDGDRRQDWGEAHSNNKRNEELFKSCQTDTIKRCARLFGVALELYGDLLDEETGEIIHRATAQPRQNAPEARQRPDNRRYAHVAPAQPQPAPQATTAPRAAGDDDPTQPALSSQVTQLFDLGRQLNIYVKKFVAAEFGGRDVNSLTYGEAELLIEDWQAEVAQQAVKI